VRLELSGGVGSLPQAPRWNADRRAVPLGRAASAADGERNSARAVCDAARSTSRLPAFRLLCFFLPSSLPDLIRQSMRKKSPPGFANGLSERQVSMDHRVKPGGDE
jgi:hypothetical protein